MNRTLSRSRALVLLLLAGLLLAACLPQPPNPPSSRPPRRSTSPAAADTVTTISWSFWGDPWEAEVNRRVARAFEAENPSIKLELIHHPWSDYFRWLRGEWQQGRSPDVMFLNYIRSYAPTGQLEPLDTYIARDRYDLSDFYPRLLELFSYQGSYYGLPRDNDTKVIFYNKRLFEGAGLDPPRAGWTWTDLRNLASRLTKRDAFGRTQQYGFAFEADTWWQLWVWQNGGAVVDDPLNPTRVLLGDPPAADALQFLYDLVFVDRTTPPADVLLDTERITQLFRTGQLAMAFGNHAQVPAFTEEAGLKWDLIGLPRREQRVNLAGGAGYTISAWSQHKDAAWALVRFLESPKGQALFAESGIIVPARRSIREDNIFLRQQPYNARIFAEETEFGRPNIHAPVSGEADRLMAEAFWPMWFGQRTPAETLRELVPQLKLLIER